MIVILLGLALVPVVLVCWYAGDSHSLRDFVPPSKLAEWHASGDTVGAIMEWLLIPTDVGNALLAEIDVPASDHVSAISSIAPSEWEEVIARPTIREVPVSLGMRGRLRQVLLSARISVGLIKPAPLDVDAGGLK